MGKKDWFPAGFNLQKEGNLLRYKRIWKDITFQKENSFHPFSK